MIVRLLLSTLMICLGLQPSFAADFFKPSPIDEESYGESYTSVVDLSDGTYILLQLMITNAGLGSQKAACRALVVPPGKKGNNSVKRVSKKEWSYSKPDKALYVDQCSLSSLGGKTDFVVKTDKAHVYLTIEQAPKLTKPPGYRIRNEKKFLESEVLIPFAKAKVNLNFAGASKKLTGWAYLDHSRSTALLPDVAARWFRFRGFYGKEPTLVQIRYPPQGGQPTGWIWKANSKPIKLKSGSIQRKRESGNNLLLINHEGSLIQIKTSAVIFEYKPVEQYGFLGTLAKPWVGNPVNTTFRAMISSGEKELRGTLEYQELNP